MSLSNDIMRFSVLGFRSDIRIELQAPVVKQRHRKQSLVTVADLKRKLYMRGFSRRGWGGEKGSGPPGKSQVAIGFHRNTSTDPPPPPPREAIGPNASRGRSKVPSVKYVDDRNIYLKPLKPQLVQVLFFL